MKKLLITIIICCSIFSFSHAQAIAGPSEGKAVVYFVRVSMFAFAINFEFFDSSKVIGKFNGQKYAV